MRIAVVGAGAWGTAMAVAAARRHSVWLWARSAAQVAAMQRERRNPYLPTAELAPQLQLTADWSALPTDALWVIATPVAGLREALARLPHAARALWLCKGLEAASGLLPHEVAAAVAPHLRVGALTGPSFAQEVAAGQPTALVAASRDTELARDAVAAFHADALRVYTSDDLVGAEVGGAVKNVLAVATGVADGLGLGANARAALITRGLAEIARFGVALGGRAETFMGLAGLGDLVLTATGELSRNRRVGLLLAQGLTLDSILSQLGHVAEGVRCAPAVVARAQALGVEMPLCEGVLALLQGRLDASTCVQALLAREARAER